MVPSLRGPSGIWQVKNATLIGRSDDCDIQIADARLSRHHARLSWQHQQLIITDLQSSNGVYVNGDRIIGSSVLSPGDLLIIGPLVSVVHIDGEEASIRTKSTSQNDIETLVPPPTEPYTSEQTTQADKNTTGYEQEQGPPSSEDLPLDASGLQENPLTASIQAKPWNRNDTQEMNMEHLTAALYPSETPSGGNPLTSRQSKQESRVIKNTRPQKAPAESANAAYLDTLIPTQQAPLDTDKLAPNTAPLASGASDSALTGGVMLNFHHSRFRLPCKRLCAGLLDGSTALVFTAVFAMPLLIGGYCLALSSANAALQAGLPVLHLSEPLASSQDIIDSLWSSAGWAQAWSLSIELLHSRNQSDFLYIFAAVFFAAVTLIAQILIQFIGATTYKGGPFWHRLLGLTIVEQRYGYYPTPARSCLRWIILFCLWPLAIPLALFGLPAPHDLLSGCRVQPRD